MPMPTDFTANNSYFEYDGKEYRNLPSQVQKNKDDIAQIHLDVAEQITNEVLRQINQAIADGTINGKSCFIRYSANADGTGFTESWSTGKNYMGVAVAKEVPTAKSSYTWVKVAGFETLYTSTGTNTNGPMTQKATTDAINAVDTKVDNLNVPELLPNTGSSTTKGMTQKAISDAISAIRTTVYEIIDTHSYDIHNLQAEIDRYALTVETFDSRISANATAISNLPELKQTEGLATDAVMSQKAIFDRTEVKTTNDGIIGNVLCPDPAYLGKYINWNDGSLVGNPAYSVSYYCEVKPQTNYLYSGSHYAFYDENFGFISGDRHNDGFEDTITSPEGAKYFRCSFDSDVINHYLIDKTISDEAEIRIPGLAYNYGEAADNFRPTSTTYVRGYADWKGRQANEYTDEKIASISPQSQKINKCIFQKKLDSFTSSSVLDMTRIPSGSGCKYILSGKGDLGGIKFGHGNADEWNMAYIAISGNYITVQNGEGDPTLTEAHGLKFKDYFYIILDVKPNDKADITIYTNQGQYVKQDFVFGTSSKDKYFCESFGTNNLTDFTFTIVIPNLCYNLWLFGDSYFSDTPNRWVYYLHQAGYEANYINGYSGESSECAYNDLWMLVNDGNNPRQVLWCMGMNDGSDSGSTPNDNWMSKINGVVAKCEAVGAELILATIPTVPTVNNEAKNAWVRNSGYRYVDFAKAVGAQPNGTWYPGMLSSDKIHPTEVGAKALYAQAIQDCPELTFPK